jgi:type VI secretion system protein ImpK
MPDYQDPFSRPDGTVIRPRPGGGRQAGGEGGRTRVPAAAPVVPAAPLSAEARALLGAGLNPLVRAASPLLLLAGQLRTARSAMDVGELRRQVLEEIRLFEERARTDGVPNDTIIAARYVLCAALDEAVLSTPWGSQSEWGQHPLLVQLHREAWGGEKFFDMLERIGLDPARHIDLMELQYLVLAFGFGGKYAVLDRGQDRLLQIQQDLYRKIREHRGQAPADLSLRWRGVEDRRNPIIRYVPWWVVAAAALVIITAVFTVSYAALARAASPIQGELALIGVQDFSTPPPVAAAPPPGPRLKQLLAAEEANRTVAVVETGNRTVVTLLAPDLFASASASVNPRHADTLRRIAVAINQVPGRVLVVGHTDDQPLRSSRYSDNFELSRERAVTVSGLLQQTLDNDARVSWNGVGALQPLYRPESDPANRARNRRVEIIHVAGE